MFSTQPPLLTLIKPTLVNNVQYTIYIQTQIYIRWYLNHQYGECPAADFKTIGLGAILSSQNANTIPNLKLGVVQKKKKILKLGTRLQGLQRTRGQRNKEGPRFLLLCSTTSKSQTLWLWSFFYDMKKAYHYTFIHTYTLSTIRWHLNHQALWIVL